MYNDFNSFFDDFYDALGTKSTRIPAVDVIEDAEGYSIDVEVPGYDKKDVDLKVENHTITIKTSDEFNKQVDNEQAQSENEYLINETHLKQVFKRVFSLPKDIDEGKISAKFCNGVLGIRIPKLQKVLARTIEISEK